MCTTSRRVLGISCLLLLLWSIQGYSQMLGNPAATLKKGEVGFGIGFEQVKRPMATANFSSSRLWLKGSFGLTQWWTISGLAGGANIYMLPKAGNPLTDFRGSFEWAYGGCTKMAVLRVKGFEVFGFGGGIKTVSAGRVLFVDEELEVKLRYDWQEWWTGGGILYETKQWMFYGACEERQSRWMETMSRENNVSKIKPHFIGGIEYHLTPSLTFNLQGKFFNETSFFIGISDHNFLK